MTRARRLLAIACLGLAAGCASAGPSEDNGPRPDPVRLEVENRATYNVVVYALYGGQQHRIGEATALGDQRMTLPRAIPDGVRVRFQLDPIGPPTEFLSQDFFLDGGDVVSIRIQPNIRQSTVSIR